MAAAERVAQLCLSDGQHWFIFNWRAYFDGATRDAIRPGDNIAEAVWGLLQRGAVSASQTRSPYQPSGQRDFPQMVCFNPSRILWVKADQG